MKNLAPEIYRQRLVIEGIYTIKPTPAKLKKFMNDLSKELKMTIIFGPIVKNLAEKINPIHKGFECILIWAESGASVYTWDMNNFFTVDVYSCKKFDVKKTVEFTKKTFEATKIVYKEV